MTSRTFIANLTFDIDSELSDAQILDDLTTWLENLDSEEIFLEPPDDFTLTYVIENDVGESDSFNVPL